MLHSLVQFAHAEAAPPAKGAPVGDLIWATAVAALLTGVVLWIASAHRSGRISWLGRLGSFAERQSGLPAWAALPAAIVGISLIIAVFGFYWDVAKHIDTGRDPSPFGTPAHWPILIGLAGITLGGFVAIVLGADRSVPTAVRIREDWYAPLGGLLIFLCGGFALTGFPLDDVWHTLFGQDVTLWGPTHVLMVGGASLSTLGLWVLLVEASRIEAPGLAAPSGLRSAALRLREPLVAGAFLIGVSTLQLEFDYGVPQFQLVYQPILIMLAAGCALVAARIRVGRGGALFAAVFYCVLNAILSGVVHGPLGESAVLHFPLYLAEAAIVELVALRIGARRPLALGLASGALIGTAGLAAEWGWSHVWMPLPWPDTLLPEAAVLGFAAALAGGALGALIGRALNGAPAGSPMDRWALAAAAIAAIFCVGFPLPMTAGSSVTATAHLRTVHPGPDRTVQGTFRLRPAGAASGSQWLTVLAWQGGGLVSDRLEQVGPGTFRTTKPIPVYDDWKAILRMEHGRALQAVPIYLPNDPAIPAKGAPAKSTFTRTFVTDKQILQREYQGGPVWVEVPAYLLLVAIAAGWMVALGLGLRRVGAERPPRPPHDRRVAPAGLAPTGGTA